MYRRLRPLAPRAALVMGAMALIAAPLALATSARAIAPMASVPVACANVVSSTTVFVGDIVSFGAPPSGCSVVSNSASGNLDRVDGSSFVAFAAGSGTMFEMLTVTAGSQTFLNQVNVTILQPPSPTPSPTTTGTATPTNPNAPTASSAPPASTAPSASASPSSLPTDPPVIAQPDRPLPAQRLQAKDVTLTSGLEQGQVVFFGPEGMPLQLLSMSGDTDAITVIDDGTNYSTRPANWQRLQYGDLCWTYAGYAGAQGFVVPVASPPFSTVPANWVLTAAIVGTSTGNVTFLEPVPGQVVDAGGDAATLTLCAKGFPTSTDAFGGLRQAPADKGGNQDSWVPGCSNGQATGNKHCTGTPTWPAYPGSLGPTSSATAIPSPASTPTPSVTPSSTPSITPPPSPTPSASPTSTPTATASPAATSDALLPVCRATGNADQPYRRELVRTSQIAPTGGDRLFPTLGWTDILPPTAKYPAGQNWLAGAGVLFGSDCRMTVVKPEPVQTISGTSLPPTPSPGPQITGFSPITIVTPLPQPSFIGYGPVYPWPPLQPVPLTGSGSTLVPTAKPTPTPSTTPTPSPSATSTPSPSATPITQPPFIDLGPACASGPCLITPVLPPTIPYTTLIEVGTGGTSASGPGEATFVLTNGPSTIAYTIPTTSLVKVTQPSRSMTPTQPQKPSTIPAGRSRMSLPGSL